MPGAVGSRLTARLADAGAHQRLEVRGWVSSYWAIRDGSLEPVSSDVRTLTGSDPVSLAEYLDAYPAALRHVQPT